MTYMFILKCALKLVEEIILYYDARSKKTSNYDNNGLQKSFFKSKATLRYRLKGRHFCLPSAVHIWR